MFKLKNLVIFVLAIFATNAVFAEAVKFSVMGAVNSPGNYSLEDTQDLYDAVAKAGDFNRVANRKKVKLVRELEDGKQKVYYLNYFGDIVKVKKGDKVDTDKNFLAIKEGDMIFVHKSRIRQAGEVFKKASEIVAMGAATGVVGGVVGSALD